MNNESYLCHWTYLNEKNLGSTAR